MEVGGCWFIDAWAVMDGFVFASQRASETILAKRTVFVAPPEFEPMPVGKISTALRATRGAFQRGFRSVEGDEIAFSSIEEVIDLVRRAYLAAGLGYDPTGG